MNIFNKFFTKFSYKFDKGYPDMDNPKDVLLLESLLSKFLNEKITLEVIDKKSLLKLHKILLITVNLLKIMKLQNLNLTNTKIGLIQVKKKV